MKTIVQDAQASLRRKYKETPALAMVTDHARTCGIDPADPFHSLVEPMDGCGVSVPVGVHRAVGGLHDAPTPGDMLCAALEVRVTAQVDVRGALGMESDVPVGFQSMTCDIHLKVKEGTPPKLLGALHAAAQRCCVVQQTLDQPPPITTRFRVFPPDTVDAGKISA